MFFEENLLDKSGAIHPFEEINRVNSYDFERVRDVPSLYDLVRKKRVGDLNNLEVLGFSGFNRDKNKLYENFIGDLSFLIKDLSVSFNKTGSFYQVIDFIPSENKLFGYGFKVFKN